YNIEEIQEAFLKAAPFPPILFKVVIALKERKGSLYKLGQEIGKDPVLSAKVLSIANSPYYGVKQKISDLSHAITLLGLNDVSMLVMRFISKKSVADSGVGKNSVIYPPKQIWLHSVKVAHLSRILVRRHKLPFQPESYMAGLLHDIGKNAIAVRIQREDEKRILLKLRQGRDQLEAEKEVLGFDHVECGFHILKNMKMSLEVLQAVRRHHEKMVMDFNDVNFILALSNILADYDEEMNYDEMNAQLKEQFDITAMDIRNLEKLYDELKIDMENL
ncbi:MAG: HDOD domain-containing protein, partial [bacterium]|nr:HDOD domain-containing protein [bacterium]